ncbi:MAG: hypothetical protein LBV74_02425 [Tannerella sp.]|jgi:hypothetical protein|nr:hypothetical protein [Tannerella sp.]
MNEIDMLFEEKRVKTLELQKEKDKIEQEIKDLTMPLLTDRKMISVVYEWFKDILSERDCPPDPASPYQRRKFLFIILMLYNPVFFTGEKMLSGLRRDIARCLNIKEESVISANCSNVYFLYKHYKDFRGDIESIYSKILDRLKGCDEHS